MGKHIVTLIHVTDRVRGPSSVQVKKVQFSHE